MLEEMGFPTGYGSQARQIFDAELSPDGKHIEFTEACDCYYSTKLTKNQVLELADDLIKLANQIED